MAMAKADGGSPVRSEEGTTRALATAGTAALALSPGALTIYLAFQSGGFFPGATAVATLIVLALLVLRVLLARDPIQGLSAPLALAAGALTLLAVWILASSAWSDSTARALTEFDRTLLYLLALVLFGTMPRDARTVRWMIWGLAGAFAALSIIGFITRTLPDVWSAPTELQRNRLSYPIGYWNALGLVAGFALVLCLHLTCSSREPGPIRILAVAAMPPVGAALLLTFSRGPLGVVVVGLVAYLVLGRPRLMPTGLVAAVPPTAVAMLAAYNADFSAEFVKGRGYEALSAAGLAEAHDLALTVGLCALGAATLRALGLMTFDPALTRLRLRRRTRRRINIGLVAVAATVVVGGVAIGLQSGWLERQYDRAFNDPVLQTGDYRDRLLNPGFNRQDRWKVAVEAFEDAPLVGQGAGTYRLFWERERPTDSDTEDAHSLYLETLGELGIVGFVLLAVGLLLIFGAMAVRLRGRDRTLWAALLSTGLVWAVHAGIDWDWELPVVTLWLFAAGGLALALTGDRVTRRHLGWGIRIAVAVALGLLAITPIRMAVSEARLSTSLKEFRAGRCDEAISAARSSISAQGNRPEPFQLEAYCQVRQGQPDLAAQTIRAAIKRDPDNWRYHYALALAQGLAGTDPRAEARRPAAEPERRANGRGRQAAGVRQPRQEAPGRACARPGPHGAVIEGARTAGRAMRDGATSHRSASSGCRAAGPGSPGSR